MTKLTDKDWEAMQAAYKSGHSFREIGRQWAYDATTISKRARKEAWGQGLVAEPLPKQSPAARLVEKALEMTPSNIEQVKQMQMSILMEEACALAQLTLEATHLQQNTVIFINKIMAQNTRLLDKYPDGFPIGSPEEAQYSRNLSVVKTSLTGINNRIAPKAGATFNQQNIFGQSGEQNPEQPNEKKSLVIEVVRAGSSDEPTSTD